MTLLSDEQLAEIEARANNATDGPWSVGVGWRDEHAAEAETAAHWVPVNSPSTDKERPHIPERVALIRYFPGAFRFPHMEARADAAFIASARTDVPTLLAHIRTLRAQLTEPTDELVEQLTAAMWDTPHETGEHETFTPWAELPVAERGEMRGVMRHILKVAAPILLGESTSDGDA